MARSTHFYLELRLLGRTLIKAKPVTANLMLHFVATSHGMFYGLYSQQSTAVPL